MYGTALSVAIDSIVLSKDSLMHKQTEDDLGCIWGKLFTKREQKKNARFALRMQANYKAFSIHLGMVGMRYVIVSPVRSFTGREGL